MTAIAEKVRPMSWGDVVGQDKAVSKLQRLAQNGNLAGRALWFSGSSGTGKTTLALLAAHEVADDWSIDAAKQTRAAIEGERSFIDRVAEELEAEIARQGKVEE